MIWNNMIDKNIFTTVAYITFTILMVSSAFFLLLVNLGLKLHVKVFRVYCKTKFGNMHDNVIRFIFISIK